MARNKTSGYSRVYARRLVISDTFAIAIAIFISYLVMFDDITSVAAQASSEGILRVTLNAPARAWVMGIVWLIALRIFNTRDRRILGTENEEYRRVFNSSLSVLGLLALASLFLKLDVSRLFVGFTLLGGTLLLFISRWSWRLWLRRQRRQGFYRDTIAISGPAGIVTELIEKLRRDPTSTFTPTLLIAIKESDVAKLMPLGIPVTTKFDDPAALLKEQGIDVLILAGSENLSGKRFKSIAWNLEGADIELIVAPGLVEASTPRVHTRPVSGISFLEVESPRFEGGQYVLKTLFDILFSLLALVVTLPITLLVALLIFLEDQGPVFFRQERIGINGKPFKMWKFRSMYLGAEKKFDELRAQAGHETNSVQFKLKNDPRITRIGKVIRKLSIDEIPQFINVLAGDMSVVGPRPHVQAEIDLYEDHVHRRLLVKPGITGPWQVGGRSLLTWEESVSLDLGYVETWSLVGDLRLILKTVVTVIKPRGSY